MKVIWYEKGTNAQKQVVYQSESKAADVQIAQLNNVLLIRDGDKIAKCMFDTVENKYKASISDLPALPLIKIDITDDFVKSKEGISGRLDIDSSQKSTIYENGVPVICNNQDYSISTAMNTFRDWTGLFSTGVGITGLYHYYITNASYKSETVETWKKMIAGKYKLLTEKKPKYYSGYVFLSYAFELFDGSITKPAPPRMFLLGDNYNKDMIWIYKIDCNEPGNSSWFSMLCYFNNHHVSAVENNIPENKLKVSQIKVKFSELDLKFDKDIIKSVIVYCSKPVNVYDFEKLELEYLHFVLGETMGGAGDDNNYDNGLPMGKTGYVYSGDEASGLSDNYKGRYSLALDKEFEKEGLIPTRFKENVINSVVLYKVEKFYTGESKDLERILDLSGIEANENITVDASGWYNTSGEMFVYNQRLHLFNYRQEFKFDYAIPYSWKYQINPPTFDWYIPPLFMSKYRHVLVYATVNVIIKTEAEYVNVIFIDLPTYVRTMRSTGEVVSFILPKYTAFPDMRAEKIDFYFRYVNSINSDVIFYHATQNLIPSKIMNVAYSANMNNDDMYSVLECIEINKDDIPTQSNLVYYNNTNIIVSELNNPFYFPVSQSYQAGAAAVQLAVAHEEITASQVGQFPLYVFTEERIFALEAGSGETL
ncbi:MAG: hypothetical protein LBF04_06915, partial [Prevotellaceae bacterium]|nr:hypothetical protein [Prevotellaceae bacterium]